MNIVLFEKGQHILIEHMDCCHRQLAGIKPSPSITGMTVDDRLQIDAPHALQRADKERIHGDQVARMACLDVPFPELWAEPLQQANLFIR